MNTRPQARPVRKQKSPYEVLGVPSDATSDEVKLAFRNQMKKYHPDNIPPHVADEFKALAERRAKEINEAYQAIRSSRRL